MRSRARPHHDRAAGGDPLRPFRHFPEHQDRLAQRRRLLLHPAAVGEHEVGAGSSDGRTPGIHRRNEDMPGRSQSRRSTVSLTSGIGMHRQDELEFREAPARGSRMAAQVERSGAPKLSRRWVVMRTNRRRGSSEASSGDRKLYSLRTVRSSASITVLPVRWTSAGGTPSAAVRRGRSVGASGSLPAGCQHPVHLLRERLVSVTGPEAGLDMPRGICPR